MESRFCAADMEVEQSPDIVSGGLTAMACAGAMMISRRKGSALKNLAGALHTDGGGCTLSVGREVKMEIPAYH